MIISQNENEIDTFFNFLILLLDETYEIFQKLNQIEKITLISHSYHFHTIIY